MTSAVRAEGKTVSTAALGAAFARTGIKVLLVDTDMFQAALGRLFGVDQRPGLSRYLIEGTSFVDVVKPTGIFGLDVIPAGLIPPNPGELLGSPRLQGLVETAKQGYDLVILDSPPLSAALDVAFLPHAVDGVLLVVKASSTTRPQARKVLSQLNASRGNVLGVVLTSAEIPADSLDYYAYRYGYRRDGSAEEPESSAAARGE